MTPTPLDYMSVRTHRFRWPWRTLTGVSLIVLFVVGVQALTVSEVESRIDAVTGSMSSKTTWAFGITSGPSLQVSPLEARLKSSGIPWTPSWQFFHGSRRTLLGGATRRDCSLAPAIYQLRPVLEEFVAASTDEELREFVRIMQSGTDEEQAAAVEAGIEKGLDAIGYTSFMPLPSAPLK